MARENEHVHAAEVVAEARGRRREGKNEAQKRVGLCEGRCVVEMRMRKSEAALPRHRAGVGKNDCLLKEIRIRAASRKRGSDFLGDEGSRRSRGKGNDGRCPARRVLANLFVGIQNRGGLESEDGNRAVVGVEENPLGAEAKFSSNAIRNEFDF